MVFPSQNDRMSETSGVVVTYVEPQSVAAQNGIVPGNTIVEVDRQGVTSPADVVDKIETLKWQRKKWADLVVVSQGGCRDMSPSTCEVSQAAINEPSRLQFKSKVGHMPSALRGACF